MTNKDKELEGIKTTVANEEERVTVAKNLIKNMARRKDQGGKDHCQKLEQLSDQLIKLANKEVKKLYDAAVGDKKKAILKTPPELVKANGLEEVAVPTVTLPVRPDGNYSRYLIGITSFSESFELVGGINNPKKLSCRGTDGLERPLLLKGRDDLRQDVIRIYIVF